MRLGALTGDNKRLSFHELPGEIQDSLKSSLDHFPFADKKAKADWYIVINDEAKKGKTGFSLKPVIDTSGSTELKALPQDLPRTLGRICNIRNLKRLAGSGMFDCVDPDFKVELKVMTKRGELEEIKPDEALNPGQNEEFAIRNLSTTVYDVTVFHIDTDYQISTVFPRPYHSARIVPVQEIDGHPPEISYGFRTRIKINNKLGREYLIVIAVPRKEYSKKYHEEINLSWLAEGSGVADYKERGMDGTLSSLVGNFVLDAKFRDPMTNMDLTPEIRLISWRTENPGS